MDKATEWDEFADLYAEIQAESRLPVEHDVTAWLASQLPLSQMNLLDLAAGTGRYAKPLAEKVHAITLVDWSEKMLQHAEVHLKDITQKKTFIQRDWHELTGNFDIVFVSQLPGLDRDEVEQILSLATIAAVFNLQTRQTDSLIEKTEKILNQDALVPLQADPKRLTKVLETPAVSKYPLRRTHFDYELASSSTVAETLEHFQKTFSLDSAAALAQQLIGSKDLNHEVPVTEKYRFDVLLSFRKNL